MCDYSQEFFLSSTSFWLLLFFKCSSCSLLLPFHRVQKKSVKKKNRLKKIQKKNKKNNTSAYLRSLETVGFFIKPHDFCIRKLNIKGNLPADLLYVTKGNLGTHRILAACLHRMVNNKPGISV